MEVVDTKRGRLRNGYVKVVVRKKREVKELGCGSRPSEKEKREVMEWGYGEEKKEA